MVQAIKMKYAVFVSSVGALLIPSCTTNKHGVMFACNQTIAYRSRHLEKLDFY